MSGLRVLHLLDECDRGGAETLVRNLCAESVRTGRSWGLCTFRGGTIAEEIRKTGVDFHKIGRRLPLDPLTLLRLRRLVVEGRFDVVHCHQQVTLLHARIATAGLPVILCCTHHGLHNTDNLKDRLTRKTLINRIDANIFVSEDQLAYYRKRYKFTAPTKVIYNALDFARIPIGPSGHRGTGVPVLIMVGHFNGVRNQMLVCRALDIIARNGIPFSMRFVGMGNRPEFHEECVRYCQTVGLQDRIEFLGSRTDVPVLLADSDVFVYASLYDTFGIALGEAMVSGLPVVVNDLPVFREIFGRYDSVAFSRADSPAAMAERLEQILSELPIWRARAQVNAEDVRRRFSMERLMGDLEDLYLSLPRCPVARLDSGA